MTSLFPHPLPSNPLSVRFVQSAALLCALLLGSPLAHAQDSVMAAPPAQTDPEVRRQAASTNASVPSAPLENPFVYGNVVFHPSAFYRFLHADGLQAAPGQPTSSDIHTVQVPLSLDLGTHWTIAYTPSWINYSADNFDDTFDQFASVRGITDYQDWRFTLSETYTHSNSILVETGQQTRQESLSTLLGASRSIGSHWQLDFTGNFSNRKGDLNPHIRDWSTLEWVTYRVAPELAIGIGGGFGYTEIDDAADLKYEQIMARVSWTPTSQLSLEGQIGRDFRHSTASAGGDVETPLLQATLTYLPFDHTSLSLSASQTMSNSAFEGDLTKNSGWTVTFNQRLLGHLYLTVDASRSETEYADTSNGAAPIHRTDKLDSYNARLTAQFRTRWNVALVFQRSENKSDETGFSFDSDQVGVELSCRF